MEYIVNSKIPYFSITLTPHRAARYPRSICVSKSLDNLSLLSNHQNAEHFFEILVSLRCVKMPEKYGDTRFMMVWLYVRFDFRKYGYFEDSVLTSGGWTLPSRWIRVDSRLTPC